MHSSMILKRVVASKSVRSRVDWLGMANTPAAELGYGSGSSETLVSTSEGAYGCASNVTV